MTTLKGGLQKNALLFSLKKRYPKDFFKMLASVDKNVNVEEAWARQEESPNDKPWEKKEDVGSKGVGRKEDRHCNDRGRQ